MSREVIIHTLILLPYQAIKNLKRPIGHTQLYLGWVLETIEKNLYNFFQNLIIFKGSFNLIKIPANKPTSGATLGGG